MFVNEWEIDESLERGWGGVRGQAARFLSDFRDEVNRASDGWPHWSVAHQAANKMGAIVTGREQATEKAFRAALTPIRAFCTRRHLECPTVKHSEVPKTRSYDRWEVWSLTTN